MLSKWLVEISSLLKRQVLARKLKSKKKLQKYLLLKQCTELPGVKLTLTVIVDIIEKKL